MSDLHIELVESLMNKFEQYLEEPMDVVDEYVLCAVALERNEFNETAALFDLLGFDKRVWTQTSDIGFKNLETGEDLYFDPEGILMVRY